MPRIRSQHPGQWTDEAFVSCSAFARLLAIALRNFADDQGVFEWKPLSLKMQIFPADAVDMPALLAELSASDQVQAFDANGKKYGAIRNFRKWQRPEKPKPLHPLPERLRSYVGLSPTNGGSEQVSSPTDGDEGGGQSATEGPTDEPVADRSPTDRGNPPQRKEIRGRREERLLSETEASDPADQPGEGTPQPAAGPPDGDSAPAPAKARKRIAYPDEFERLWSAYPTDPNMSKSKALEAWKRLTEPDRAKALAAMAGFAAYCARRPDYRPVHLVRFITDRRFDGFVAAVGQAAPPDASTSSANGGLPTVDDDRWRSRVRLWQEDRSWVWHRDSPPPNEWTCTVPAAILAEFGITLPPRVPMFRSEVA